MVQMFQSKQAFGFDWPDARMHVSIAGVRSIKNMTQRLPGLQRAFVGILEREFDEVLSKNLRGDGRFCWLSRLYCCALLLMI
jgi:hypothetical protein